MIPKITQKELAQCYQPLFDLMADEYDIILTASEMDEIISVSQDVTEALSLLMRPVCDVEGCNLLPTSGGVCWNNTGYWSVCSHHSAKYRNGESQPQMKQDAIAREASRLPNGCIPI